MVYGTPEYMAPEQALGQEVDARADLYALGVLLFEMLTGSRPFESDSKVALLGMKVTSDPPTLASKNPSVRVGEAVEATVRRLLDKEASARFQSASEVLEAFESCRLGEARTERPMAHGSPTPLNVPASRRYRASLASVPRGATQVALGDVKTAHLEHTPAPDASKGWSSELQSRWVSLTRKVPRRVLLVALGGVLLMVLVVVIGSIRGFASGAATEGAPSASASVPLLKRLLEPPTAPAEELAAAVASGASPPVEKLSTTYPDDPAVWRALVRAYTKEKRGADAMGAVTKLVALSDRAKDDDEVSEAVTAAMAGPAESTDAAFALLEGGLGTKGPDLLYELSTTKGVAPRTLTRLKQTLAKPQVKGRMSPALAIALELRAASGCESKKSLLGRAKEQGDARSLASLRNLQAPKGCGFLGLGDCWSCLRKDNALGAAIAAIEERAGK
jgi:serine/threonine-protein kinase